MGNMGERCAEDLGFIVVVLLVAWLLGFLIAWLIRASKIKELQLEIDDLKNNNNRLRADLESLQVKAENCEKELGRVNELNEALNSKLNKMYVELENCEKESANLSNRLLTYEKVPFDADAAKEAMGKAVNEDDLTVIEGIGPKISELLNSAGITNWAELSDSSVDKLREILKEAGTRFGVHKPDTWSRQAGMAARGEWKALKEWQDYLDGGKEV
jgi:predicted flap endonuclease-1-like 5' DNA nuclease